MDSTEFAEQFKEIFKLAISWVRIAHREGLLALEEFADKEKISERDIFQLGVRLTIDGTDASFIDKVLTNIINLETDQNVKILKTIQKEAVLGILGGMNLYSFALLLNSYVDNGITVSLED